MKKNVMNFFKFYSLPLLSGILAGTSYIPFPPWAVFFCFAPLWHFCLKHSNCLKSNLIGSWLFQFTFSAIGFYWLIYTIHVYGQMPQWVAVLGWLVFCSLAHLHFVLAQLGWFYLIRLKPFQKTWAKWISLPLLTSITTSLLPMLFKWNFGYTWFWAKFPAFQTAEIWGFEFIHTLVLFFQLCFLSLTNKKLSKILIPTGVSTFLFLNLWGLALEKRIQTPNRQFKTLMVQHNIGNYINFSGSIRGAFQKTTDKLIQLTQKTLNSSSDIDFILWSEGAYPYLLSKPSHFRFLQKIATEKFQTTLITGASSEIKNNITNSIFFIHKNKSTYLPPYHKNHLLAFGEYIPGDKWFPALRVYFLGSHRAFIAGTEGPSVRKINSLYLGLQICYESLFPSFTRDLARKKMNALVNITNDSWFGPLSEPYQHLWMTLARGIETRTPVIRLSTTGFSAVMTSKGTLLAQSPLHKEWAKVVSVPYETSPRLTIFSRWGYWLNHLLFLVIFLIILSLYFVIEIIKPRKTTLLSLFV